ncbi:MAG: glycoside hydrolase family 3 C-terminal domain-containing protein [Lachnospiraceae bacterium]
MRFFRFYPGPYGGLALAQLLYGQESPSGRLPISIPAHGSAAFITIQNAHMRR